MLGLWAKTAGAFRVILCDIDPTKVEFARKQGSKEIIDFDLGQRYNSFVS